MANPKKYRGTIGILYRGWRRAGSQPCHSGGDDPGVSEGYQVIGIRRGWAGLMEIDKDRQGTARICFVLTEELVNRVGRSGGTFLHTSRSSPAQVPKPFRLTCGTNTPRRSTT